LNQVLLVNELLPARVNVKPVSAAAVLSPPAKSWLSSAIWALICPAVTFPAPLLDRMTCT